MACHLLGKPTGGTPRIPGGRELAGVDPHGSKKVRETIKKPVRMNALTLVNLIEEMMDLKLQQHSESHLKPNPEVARILAEKRVTDQRRLEHIRAELVRLLTD